MATKQNVLLLRKNVDICEINKEYPSLKRSSIPRHLCTSTATTSKVTNLTNMTKLLEKITTEQYEKDSTKHGKQNKDQIEIIQLYENDQEQDKLYRKSRYQLTNSHNYENESEEETRDNRN